MSPCIKMMFIYCNIEVKKDWRGIIPSLLWSWILAWIPSIIIAINIYLTKYELQSNGTLLHKSGVIRQRYTNIDLYRVKNASAEINLISGGKLILTNSDGSIQVLPYIKNADQIANVIRGLVNEQRKEQGVSPIEML